MKNLYTLILLSLCMSLSAQRFYPDRSLEIESQVYSSSMPELRFSFSKYIPIYERVPLSIDSSALDKNGNSIYEYTLTDAYYQIYRKGPKKNNKKEGTWDYYFFGEMAEGDRSNKMALRSRAFFHNDRLMEIVCGGNNIVILSKDGISPKASNQIINIVEDLELRYPVYIAIFRESTYNLEAVALSLIEEIIKKDKSQAEVFHYKHNKLQEYQNISDGVIKDDIWLDITQDGLSNEIKVQRKKKYINEVLILDEEYLAENNGKYVRSYYENGTRQSKGKYNPENEKTGKWKSYYPNGNVFETGKFIDGEKSGVWKRYNEEGKLIEKTKY